jgi:hypothetical protein
VGGFFRDADDGGELKLSPFSETIFKFVGHTAAAATP